ncbi:hypothetical protein NL389_34320, partial [Klebsiella pneumoniae]|nr:hypothetical protein [Klebsiella pneumoniae]
LEKQCDFYSKVKYWLIIPLWLVDSLHIPESSASHFRSPEAFDCNKPQAHDLTLVMLSCKIGGNFYITLL